MEDNNELLQLPKSKSQKKREMHALQDIGEELAGLNAEQLNKLPLSEELREAISSLNGIKAHGARRRQMQYIGRLMRSIDPAPIQQALNDLRMK